MKVDNYDTYKEELIKVILRCVGGYPASYLTGLNNSSIAGLEKELKSVSGGKTYRELSGNEVAI